MDINYISRIGRICMSVIVAGFALGTATARESIASDVQVVFSKTDGEIKKRAIVGGILFASDNENSQFVLHADFESVEIAESFLGIKVSSVFYEAAQTSWGAIEDPLRGKLVSVETKIGDSLVAKKIADNLKLKIVRRQRPKCSLDVRFSSKDPVPQSGKPPIVTATIVNGGGATAFLQFVTEFPSDELQRTCDFEFAQLTAGSHKNVANVRNDMHHGGMVQILELRSGEMAKFDIDLGKWFQFLKPGEYSFIGVFRAKYLKEPNDMRRRVVYQWEECIGDDFTVSFR